MKIKIKIFRYSPDIKNPYYDGYEFDAREDMVILDVLNEIKKQDGTLSYRRSCRHGICGSCAVKLNSKPVLACKTSIKEAVEEFGNELVIEPLDKKKVIKDLVIKKTDFWKKHEKVKPFLAAPIDEHPKMENLVKPEEVEKLENAEACISCGCCYYACESERANEKFLGPHALNKVYRFCADIRDRGKKERLEIVNELGQGIWDCVKCQSCVEVCPKGINPFDKITHLHNMSFEENVAENNVATRHAKGFLYSIKKHGILDEGMLVLYSEGVFALKHLKEAAAMFKKGKIKLPWEMPKSNRLEEIQKLIEISKEKR